MKAWTLSRGSRYDGGTIISVHVSADSAQAALEAELKQHAEELADLRHADLYWDDDRFDMKQERPGYWRSSSDFICLQEWDAE